MADKPEAPKAEENPYAALYQQSLGTPETAPSEESAPAQRQMPTMSAAPPSGVKGWLTDLESDLRGGGGRTVIGRGIGHMQGRGDQGMSGLEASVGPGVANEMGSIPLGLTKMAQGIAEHKPLKTISGGLQAASLPLQFMGGPEVETLLSAVPSKAHAGQLFETVMNAAQHQPVTMTRTMEPLERAQQLSSAGHGTVSALDNLYKRINTINPVPYREARDWASGLSRLTGQDKMAASPSLQSAAKQVSHGLRTDIGNAAANVGQAENYANALKEYSRAARMSDMAGTVGSFAKKALLPAGAAGLGYELYRTLSGR